MSSDTITAKPITHQADLAKLPRALTPLIGRSQWAIWRWTPKPGGGFQKPPFMATRPERHASVTDSSSWNGLRHRARRCAGRTRRRRYLRFKQDGFAAIDLDYCRDVVTGSVECWAQLMLEQALHSYAEITPSGDGLTIWGTATGDALHRKFELDTGDKAAVELFRATNKALTISGLDLRQGRSLGNIDRLMDWSVFFGEKHKPALTTADAPIRPNGNGHGLPYSLDEIEVMVSTGALPPGANRSDMFHAIVGHYVGCGWDAERLRTYGQFPDGIGGRYLSEGRLSGEVARSVGKYNAGVLPASESTAGSMAGKRKHHSQIPNSTTILQSRNSRISRMTSSMMTISIWMMIRNRRRSTKQACHRSTHTAISIRGRSRAGWSIRGSGRQGWGAGKTFVVFELAAALGSNQPFLGHVVKRQCGVLLIAAEGASEVRLRLDAVIRAKCGGMQRAPVRWYETVPMLLHKGAVETLIARPSRPRLRCSRNSACRSALSLSTPSPPVLVMRAPGTRMIRQSARR